MRRQKPPLSPVETHPAHILPFPQTVQASSLKSSGAACEQVNVLNTPLRKEEMISGKLEEMNLAEVLRLLSMSSQSGELKIAEEFLVGSIFLRSGQIAHCSYHIRNMAGAPYEINGLDGLSRLCRHKAALFRFDPGLSSSQESLQHYPTEKLIRSIEQQVSRLEPTQPLVPPPDARPLYLKNESSSAFNAPPEAVALLMAANGKRSIAEIALSAQVSTQYAQRWMDIFQEKKVVEIYPPQPFEPQPTEASLTEAAAKKRKPARYWRGKRID
jgi:hypothetical protein